MNNVNLTGRWVTDFSLREVGEKKKAEGRIAVQVNKDTAHFFDVTCWEKTADIALQYCKKGDFALLSGRLAQDTWEKDGEKRSKVYVVADRIDLPPLPPKEGGSDKVASPAKEKPKAASDGKRRAPVDDDDSDLF